MSDLKIKLKIEQTSDKKFRVNIQNPQFLQISTNFLPKSTTPYEIVKNPQKSVKIHKNL